MSYTRDYIREVVFKVTFRTKEGLYMLLYILSLLSLIFILPPPKVGEILNNIPLSFYEFSLLMILVYIMAMGIFYKIMSGFQKRFNKELRNFAPMDFWMVEDWFDISSTPPRE